MLVYLHYMQNTKDTSVHSCYASVIAITATLTSVARYISASDEHISASLNICN